MPNREQPDITCFDVADYFLSLVDEDSGDSISNLKLQKLVYYAQGLHLACFDRPLFNEDIQAWAHGPVIPELYYKYREYASDPLPMNMELDLEKFNDDTKEFLNVVQYGPSAAFKCLSQCCVLLSTCLEMILQIIPFTFSTNPLH